MIFQMKTPDFCKRCKPALLEQTELPCKQAKCLEPEAGLECGEDHCRWSCMFCEYDQTEDEEDDV